MNLIVLFLWRFLLLLFHHRPSLPENHVLLVGFPQLEVLSLMGLLHQKLVEVLRVLLADANEVVVALLSGEG